MGKIYYRSVFITIGLVVYCLWFFSVLWIGHYLSHLLGLSLWLLAPCFLAIIGLGGYIIVEALGWMFYRLIE
jgi:hypothetical protein